MALLPLAQLKDPAASLLMTKWKSQLDPLLKTGNPTPSPNVLSIVKDLPIGQLIENVSLGAGVTVIDHELNKLPVGWILTDINGSSSIYRSAAFNSETLTLTSSAAVIVSIFVF
jgi:hypothetical protein